ncbi:MAG: prephenate dehydratase, partial [Candidatus Omnitrophica bacterium CG11_big_fil_rev_8_21_14_0_20_64_10]
KLRAVPIPIAEKNRTRFLVLSLKTPPKGRKNKTSLMFALKDRPGALHRALAPFTRHHINMSRIESRPSKRRAWEYLFFVDLEGHRSDKRVAAALRGVARQTAGCKVLGSYPLRQR